MTKHTQHIEAGVEALRKKAIENFVSRFGKESKFEMPSVEEVDEWWLEEIRTYSQNLIEKVREEEMKRIHKELKRLLKTSTDALDTEYIKSGREVIAVPKGNNTEDSYYNLALIHLEEKLLSPTSKDNN